MESNEFNDRAKTDMVPEVANFGIVRPPFIYLGAIAPRVCYYIPHGQCGSCLVP
jgi:hypothetical protein